MNPIDFIFFISFLDLDRLVK